MATRPAAEALTELHEATRRGDAQAVQRLLDAGADANVRSAGGLTPLHAAMDGARLDAMIRSTPPPEQREHWSAAKARARERATRGQPDPRRGPMQFVKVARLLLARGADARSATADGLTPLHLAASSHNAELVSLLIAAKADVNAVERPRGVVPVTPLTNAAATGDVDVVRALLDAGADPARVPEESRRHLLFLAMSDLDVFRLLLDRGLELPPDALKIAVQIPQPEAAAEIVRRHKAAGQDVALYAAITASGHGSLTPQRDEELVGTVRLLLDAGASPAARDGRGDALLEAVVRGRTAVSQLLRERGAKIDWPRLQDHDYQPEWLAYAAAFENHLDRLRELEALGMPLDALGAAVLGRAGRLRELITSQKADVKGDRGSTAMYFAAVQGHLECVRVLLDAGSDPNARVPSWDTPDIGPRPLDGAASGGHADVVRLLLDRGADPRLMTLTEEDRAKLPPAVRELLDAPSSK